MKERKRKRFIKNYAKQFLQVLKTDHPDFFHDVSMPSIKSFRYFGCADPADVIHGEVLKTGNIVEIAGWASDDGKAIELYGFARQTPEGLRTTIRHEMLHAALAQAGQPHEDDDVIFLLLCVKYIASPYALLPEILEEFNIENLINVNPPRH